MGTGREGFDIFRRVCWHAIRRHGRRNWRFIVLDSTRHILGHVCCKRRGHHAVVSPYDCCHPPETWCAVCGKYLGPPAKADPAAKEPAP